MNEKKDKASLALSEKKVNPHKFKFFTYEPPKNEFLTKKRFKIRVKKDYTKSKASNIYITQGYWAKSDHKKFIEALYLYDCDWKKIQKYIKNRIYNQVCSHAQKFYNRLKDFKDEELGLDFTSPNVKGLKDIIKIIKEKEFNSENCGKLLFIIVKSIISLYYYILKNHLQNLIFFFSFQNFKKKL